jgi:excisionase family DNA binding protein
MTVLPMRGDPRRREDHSAGAAPTRPPRRHLTVAELCEELSIARSTFYDWRAKKTAPRCMSLPNGELRIRRVDFDAWLDSRLEDLA